MKGPCMCGSPDCPSCGGAQGTYRSPMTMYDLIGALTLVTRHLQSAIEDKLEKGQARDAVTMALELVEEFGLCEACELRPAADGAYLCDQCSERAAESIYEDSQSECFRGGEREAFEAEEQDRIQRELKR